LGAAAGACCREGAEEAHAEHRQEEEVRAADGHRVEEASAVEHVEQLAQEVVAWQELPTVVPEQGEHRNFPVVVHRNFHLPTAVLEQGEHRSFHLPTAVPEQEEHRNFLVVVHRNFHRAAFRLETGYAVAQKNNSPVQISAELASPLASAEVARS
jgi:hypothetical protein